MNAVSGFVVFALLLSVTACAPISCPMVEDLTHCTCKRVAYGLRVVCSEFTSGSDLQKDFHILRDYAVQSVLLYKLDIQEVLPEDIFSGMQVQEITVEKCKLKFSQPAFTGLGSTLHILNVADNTLLNSSMIGTGDFSLAKLSKLNELYVKKNNMPVVVNEWLNEKVPNVRTVVLDENDITKIDKKAFSTLQQLKVLSLAENRIQEVQRSMMPSPAWHLEKIDLSFNKLQEIPVDFFDQMPVLRDVVLSQNDLKSLDETTWWPIWEQLGRVLLFENKIDCSASNLQWIKERKRPSQLGGFCVTPERMAGKRLQDVYQL